MVTRSGVQRDYSEGENDLRACVCACACVCVCGNNVELSLVLNSLKMKRVLLIYHTNWGLGSKGPYALGWQNLFGSTKNEDKFCLYQIFIWQKFVLLWGRTTALLKFGSVWQNLVGIKTSVRTYKMGLMTNIFAK